MVLIRFIVTALIVFAIAFPGALSAQKGSPPQNTTSSRDICAGGEFGSCRFPINLSAEGKAKTIVIRGGKLILTSPRLVAVVTNLTGPLAGVVVAVGNVSWSIDTNGKLTQPLKM